MRKIILIVFLLLIANLLLCWLHIEMFKTSFVWSAWITGFAHIVLLIIFPYKKIFKQHEIKKSNTVR